jgi:peptide deformylase
LIQLADPEITFREGREVAQEGCLSLPGVLCDVARATRVVVKGKNRKGRVQEVRAEGWLARIFQHEVDHLDGILITDRVESPADIHYDIRLRDCEHETSNRGAGRDNTSPVHLQGTNGCCDL